MNTSLYANLKQSKVKAYAIHFPDSSTNLGTTTQKGKINQGEEKMILLF